MEDYIFHNTHPQRINNGPLRNRRPKTKRNDPCHCGSGLKYKKCCLINKVIEMEKPLAKEPKDV